MGGWNVIGDDEDINNTVLAVFLDLSIPPSGRLGHGALREEWPKYHLRATDLDSGIQRLVARGDLSLLREDGLELLALTQQGYEHGLSTNSPSGIVHSLWTSLRATLWPEPRRHGSGARRRSHRHRSTDRTRVTDLS
jgi:hypothetical protein